MIESTAERDPITPLIGRYFNIEKIVPGGGKYPYVMRYEGRLHVESERAHRELSKELKSQRLTVMFLEEGENQIIQIMPGLAKPRPSNPWINLLFFVATALSMLYTGIQFSFDGPLPSSTPEWLAYIGSGFPFAASLLAILLAHEFGHYLAARYHKTAVTLPYFLPLPAPISPFGTLGAFIQLKEPPPNKKVLFDIGVAGPLAGLVVAIPILLLGLSLSKLEQLPAFFPSGSGIILEGNSILYLVSKYLVFHQWLPAPQTYGSVSPLFYWIRYFFTGLPTPLGGMDVTLHSVAWAGWAGLLVTALNLIPAGQLDGGHVLYSLLGKRVNLFLPIILIALLGLSFIWPGWWLWLFLIILLGRSHAQPLDQITKLDPARKALGIFALIIFVLVFIPVPLRQLLGPFGGP